MGIKKKTGAKGPAAKKTAGADEVAKPRRGRPVGSKNVSAKATVAKGRGAKKSQAVAAADIDNDSPSHLALKEEVAKSNAEYQAEQSGQHAIGIPGNGRKTIMMVLVAVAAILLIGILLFRKDKGATSLESDSKIAGSLQNDNKDSGLKLVKDKKAANNNLEWTVECQDGKLEAKCIKKSYNQGKLSQEDSFLNKMLDGESKTISAAGEVTESSSWKAGKRHGVTTFYGADKKPTLKCEYTDGKVTKQDPAPGKVPGNKTCPAGGPGKPTLTI